MIVCRTNPQARKVHEWFKNNSKLSTGLVITDANDPAQSQINKNNQIDFRDTLAPDILIVNFMLTTGYDVKRLKKMYLLRGPHAQSLLQTISRVNRPYKAPTGKVYKNTTIPLKHILKSLKQTLMRMVRMKVLLLVL